MPYAIKDAEGNYLRGKYTARTSLQSARLFNGRGGAHKHINWLNKMTHHAAGCIVVEVIVVEVK